MPVGDINRELPLLPLAPTRAEVGQEFRVLSSAIPDVPPEKLLRITSNDTYVKEGGALQVARQYTYAVRSDAVLSLAWQCLKTYVARTAAVAIRDLESAAADLPGRSRAAAS